MCPRGRPRGQGRPRGLHFRLLYFRSLMPNKRTGLKQQLRLKNLW